MTTRPDKISVISPVEMGLRLIKDGGQPEIYCPKCNGWILWVPGKEICPGCWEINAEAAALVRGMKSAATILQLGGETDGSQIATAGDRNNRPQG